MSIIGLMKKKLKSQDKHPYEATEEYTNVYFTLGNASASINIRDALELDRSHQKVQHMDECIKNQSVVCPTCESLVFIEQHHAYEGTYYDAFCKKCHWSSDDENGREPINKWLDENDYYFSCDCPSVEEPPQAEFVANHMFQMLQHKNEKVRSSARRVIK